MQFLGSLEPDPIFSWPPIVTTPFEVSSVPPSSVSCIGPDLLFYSSWTDWFLFSFVLALDELLESVVVASVFDKRNDTVTKVVLKISCFLLEHFLQLFLCMIIDHEMYWDFFSFIFLVFRWSLREQMGLCRPFFPFEPGKIWWSGLWLVSPILTANPFTL